MAARTGGEEFVLVMRQASLPLAAVTAERIRASFAAGRVETRTGVVNGTASAGIAVSQLAEESFEHMLHRADTALYRAKDNGRDRVCTELQAVA